MKSLECRHRERRAFFFIANCLSNITTIDNAFFGLFVSCPASNVDVDVDVNEEVVVVGLIDFDLMIDLWHNASITNFVGTNH